MVIFTYDYQQKMYVFAAGIDCCKANEVDSSGSFMSETLVCARKGKTNVITDVYEHLGAGKPVPVLVQNELYSILSSVMKGKNLV